MRLIDADALVAELKWLQSQVSSTSAMEIAEYIDRINVQPTVEAVVLPCKLGDSVFIIVNLRGGNPSHIVERRCTGIHITEKVFGHRAEKASRYLVTNSDIGFAQHIPFSQFGKAVFFTRKEAEAALAKTKGGVDNA